jgi:putative intracellular protease/amidase
VTRALAIVSSNTEAGFWLSELTHPYWHLQERGIEVDIASPAGAGAQFNAYSDPRNEGGAEAGDLVSLGFLGWPPAMAKLDGALPLGDVDVSRYDGFWIAGGTGPVFDLHANDELDRLIVQFWSQGSPAAAICHGVIGLATAVADGTRLVAGRAVTAYSLAEDRQLEELVSGGAPFLPSYPETVLREAGGRYSAGAPGAVHVVRSEDGRILTAQNQQSATAFGLALAALLAGDA